jgi:hypothetical protein
VPGCAYIRQRDALLQLGHTLALQIRPGLPLFEARIARAATEVQIFQRSQASAHALAVFRQSLANQGHKAAAGSFAELGEQFSGFQDSRLPGLGFVVQDGSRLGRLLDQACRAPDTV